MMSCLLWMAIFLLWPSVSSQKECKEPQEVDFGEIISNEKATYLENDRVQYKCNSGYLLEGSEWIQCNRQEWTPSPPKCLAPCSITKEQLATKNLFLLGSRRKSQLIQSNQTLQFRCREGYVLTGSSARMCVDGRMDLPLCISEQGRNCSGPPKIENGDIISLSEKQYRSGSSVEYQCQHYYVIEGHYRSFCDNGTWTKVPTCLDPCTIPGDEMESQKIEVKGREDKLEDVYILRGSSIELTCKTGYTLPRNVSQSVFEFHCDSILPELPQCKEIQCLPPEVRHGHFQPKQVQYAYNEEIHLVCDQRFIFQGQGGISKCTQNGWDPPAVCRSRGCDYIVIKNGKLSRYYEYWRPFPRAEGQTIDYGCNSGYLAANRDRWHRATCTKFGYVPEPKCFKTCDPSLHFHHGQFIHNNQSNFIEGDNIMLSCNKGYYPAEKQLTARCTEDGWSPSPRCVQIDSTCPEPPRVENAEIIENTKEKYLPGQHINYRCNDGFEISGLPTITCMKKNWSQLPRCEDATCSSPPIIDNGEINGQIKERYLPLEKVSYRCRPRYSLFGSPVATCSKRRWTEAPKCIDAGGNCGRLPPIENGDIKEIPKVQYLPGESVTYQCQSHYRMEGFPRVTCRNGHWSEIPTCTVPCTASKEDMRRHNIQLKWLGNKKLYSEAGGVIEFACKRGFHPHPHSKPFRIQCIEGKLDYPDCIRN